jgi:hypothetical protein
MCSLTSLDYRPRLCKPDGTPSGAWLSSMYRLANKSSRLVWHPLVVWLACCTTNCVRCKSVVVCPVHSCVIFFNARVLMCSLVSHLYQSLLCSLQECGCYAMDRCWTLSRRQDDSAIFLVSSPCCQISTWTTTFSACTSLTSCIQVIQHQGYQQFNAATPTTANDLKSDKWHN